MILLLPTDFIDNDRVRLCGRRLQHVQEVHRAAPGDRLRVGLLNGNLGEGEVVALSAAALELRVTLDQPPPPPLPLTLLLALPRPKMLRRIFQTCATLGVRDIYLLNAYRVEKSYWQSPHLTTERINEQLVLGLEQGVATQLPQVHLIKRFKPFVEDQLPTLVAHKRALVAHPYHAAPCPPAEETDTLLAIGPEGGFISYEVEKLQQAGLSSIHLGPRILRVETALPFLAAKLF
nr:16S rRNA (uracil(1498)-N(3))-methyltransferase [Motiliproteus sediminis]